MLLDTLYTLIQILLISGVCLFAYIVLHIHNVHNRYKHIPGPPRDNFFLGHLPTLQKWQKEKGYILGQSCEEWMRTYGFTIVIYILHNPLVVTIEPETIKELYLTHGHIHNKAKDWGPQGLVFGARYLGRGLVTEPLYHLWLKRRAVLNVPWQGVVVHKYLGDFNKIADRMIAKLTPLADGKTVVDVHKEIMFACLEGIAKFMCNKDLDIINDNRGVMNPFMLSIIRTFHGFTYQRMNPILNFKFWEERELKTNVRQAIELTRSTLNRWLKERRQAMDRGETVADDTLTAMLKAETDQPEIMPHDSEIDDLITMFMTGMDTVSHTIAFALYHLCKNADVENKMMDEMNDIMGTRTDFEESDLSKADYSQKVIKETLRFHPSAALAFKTTGKNTMFGNVPVPEGTPIAVSPYIAGRHEMFHKDPLAFRPERFNADCKYKPTMLNYFPFLIGERNCIGRFVTRIEGQLFLMKLMKHFKFDLPPDYVFGLKEHLSMRPLHDLKAILSLRK